jgi:hypothetical protein
MVFMEEMANAFRRRAAGIAALVVAAAAVVVAVRSCDSTEPEASPDATPAERSATPAATALQAPKPERRPRVRAATEAAPLTDASPKSSPSTKPATKQDLSTVHKLRVLRPDGTPAAGATIVVSNRPLWSDWPSQSGYMWPLRVTDAEGSAGLPRTESVPYVHLGSDVGWSYKPGSVVPLPDVRLRPGVVVRGRTIDSDALPVAGANVRAEMFPPGAGGSIVVEANSNAQGDFELPPLPFDEDGNGRQDIDMVAYADGLVPGSATTTRTDAPKGPIVVTLYRGGALRGRLVRSDALALRPVRVLLAGTHLAAFADADGRFELRLPAAGGEVIVHDALTATSDAMFRPAAGTFTAARRLGTFRGDAGDRELGNVVVDGGKPVRGVVVLGVDGPVADEVRGVAVRATGAPVAGASVKVLLAGTEFLQITTDGQGVFEVPISGDEHDLVATERSGGAVNRMGTIHGVHGGDPDVRIILSGMGIVVHLRDENGARIEVVRPSLNAAKHGQPTNVAYASWDTSKTVLLARSEVRVQVPTEGAWDVILSATGFEDEAIENVEVRADRDAEIDVRLRRKP